MGYSEKELKIRIKDSRDELQRKRNYLKSVRKEVEEVQILLNFYETELKKLRGVENPSSRMMNQ